MTQLPDGRTLFVLGDTGYYNLASDGSAGPLLGFGTNSAWVQAGNCFTLLEGSADNRSWIAPPQHDGTVYWPGAAVVVGNRLHVFLTRLYLDNPFGTPVGSAVATFELPSLELARIVDTPFTPDRIFGSGAVYDDGFLYVYGSHRESCAFCFAGDMYVARVPETLVQDPTAWRYWAGSWSDNARAAVSVLDAAVSNTNVEAWRNGFLLVTKTMSIVAPDVDAWWSSSPVGPWQHLGTVYHVPDPVPYVAGYTYQGAYSYGPVALPTTLVDGGRVLLAYNVNSFDASDAQVDGRMSGPRFTSIVLPDPPGAGPRPVSEPARSPWVPTLGVDRAGRVHATDGGVRLDVSSTRTAVGVARTPTGGGSWAVATDGGIFTSGDAPFFGSTGGIRLNKPVVGVAATPTGRGYWLVASDGGVFTFGDAQFFGSTGSIRLNQPIVGMSATATGRGYWLVASDGGVFSFGDAQFFGSTGNIALRAPIVDIAVSPSGRGYWMVTLFGEVFSFGDATYHGNVPWPPSAYVVGMTPSPGGYRIVDALGRVFHLGGSTGATQIPTLSVIVGTG